MDEREPIARPAKAKRAKNEKAIVETPTLAGHKMIAGGLYSALKKSAGMACRRGRLSKTEDA
jgi:hypothetical protein